MSLWNAVFGPSAVPARTAQRIQPTALCHGWQADRPTVDLAVAEIDFATGNSKNNNNSSSGFPTGSDVVVSETCYQPHTQVAGWQEKLHWPKCFQNF